jgi:flagellar basal body-associated protein FliL
MTYFDSALSVSILVAVTIERIISTVKPYQMKKLCTVASATTISGIIIVVMLLMHSHVLYGFSLFHTEISITNNNNNSSNGTNATDMTANLTENTSFTETNQRNCNISGVNEISNCSRQAALNSTVLNEDKEFRTQLVKICWLQNPGYVKFYNSSFQIVTILLLNVIPECIFLVGGIIIVRKLMTVRRRVASNQMESNGNQHNNQADSNSRQITVTLLLVNIVFVICTMPVLIFLVKRSDWVDEKKGMTETQEIIWAIFNLMFYTNHAVNFILYFLSGKKFRKQVIAVFRCRNQSSENFATRTQVTSVL